MKQSITLIVFLVGFLGLWGQNNEADIDPLELPSPQNQIESPVDSGELSTSRTFFDFAVGTVLFGSGKSLRQHLKDNDFGHTSSGLFGGGGASYPESGLGFFYSGNLEYQIWPHLGLGAGLGLSGITGKTEGFNGHSHITLFQRTIAAIPSLEWYPKGKGIQLAVGPAIYWNKISAKDYSSSLGEVSNTTFGVYGALSWIISSQKIISSHKRMDTRMTLRYLYIGTTDTPPYTRTEYDGRTTTILPTGQAELNSLLLGLSLNFGH